MGSIGTDLAVMERILELVKPILEHSKTEQEADQDHHQNQARAQHAHLTSTAHPVRFPLVPGSRENCSPLCGLVKMGVLLVFSLSDLREVGWRRRRVVWTFDSPLSGICIITVKCKHIPLFTMKER